MDVPQQASLFPTYEELLLRNPDRLDELVEALKKLQREQATSSHVDDNLCAQDVTSTCKKVENELKELTDRRQTASFMLVAGTGASHDIEPYCFVDEKSRKYIEEFLGMTVQELCTKFDIFARKGLQGFGQTDNEKRTILKKAVRQMLYRKLREITGPMRPPSQLQYANYETDIVHKYGVELAGWPHNTFVLDRLGREPLQEVVDGLLRGTIKWTRLSDKELKSRIDAWKAKQGNQEQTKKPKKRVRLSDEEVHSNINNDEPSTTASEQCLDKETSAA